jgi:hypothetical protein
VGRYPDTNESKEVVCYQVVDGVGSNVSCVNSKLIYKLDNIVNTYAQIPTDPDPTQKYIYESDGSSFALYTALQNVNDKDLLVDENGVVLADPYNVACGNVSCNYKITEVGLTKQL